MNETVKREILRKKQMAVEEKKIMDQVNERIKAQFGNIYPTSGAWFVFGGVNG